MKCKHIKKCGHYPCILDECDEFEEDKKNELHILIIYGALNRIIEQRINSDENFINSELFALKEIYPKNKIYKGIIFEIT